MQLQVSILQETDSNTMNHSNSGGSIDFSDSSNDFFQNMLDDDGVRNNNNIMSGNESGESDEEALWREAFNRSNTSLTDELKDGEGDVMMDAAFDKSPLFGKSTLETLEIAKLLQVTALPDVGSLTPSGGGPDWPSTDTTQDQSFGQQHFFWNTDTDAKKPLNDTLVDATPLNLLFGSGAEWGTPGKNNNNIFGGGEVGTLPTSHSFGMSSQLQGFGNSMRGKTSNNNLANAKFGSVIKASRSSTKMRSNKSDGLLARAFKQKYNSNNNLNRMNPNGDKSFSAQIPRNAISSFGSGIIYPAGTAPTFGTGLNQGQGGGVQNASWGAQASSNNNATKGSQFSTFSAGNSSSRRNDTSMFSSPNQGTTDAFSPAPINTNSKSSSTMQDALRMYKKQAKSQSALRQSSQQSLQMHSHSVTAFGKTDIQSLLPPQHTAGNKGITSGSHNFLFNLNRNVPSNTSPLQNNESQSLLHQSCRLYPTTVAVVESALRVDPDAVRKPITPQLEKGQAKKLRNTYGYPLNMALSHGGSLDVLKMLAEAAPEILLEGDGTDGSRSLGIAVMAKYDWQIISMLLRTNRKCIQMADRRGNYPLHIAANHGIPFGIVKKLYRLFPKALQMRNFHSETPLDIAQRSTRCSEEVMNFLQAAAFSGLESAEMEDVLGTKL